MDNSLQDIVTRFDLLPHPEGGYFKEIYRSKQTIPAIGLSDDYQGERSQCTSIYFVLTSENSSAFHKIKQDEIWHFYDGSPIRLHVITDAGEHRTHIIGRDIVNGQQPQLVVEGGDWFAAEVVEEDAFSFVGCTVAPGFDFQDFELAERDTLTAKYPRHREVIERFSRV